MRVCHSRSPVAASMATKLPEPSLVNSSPVAVVRKPVPMPAPVGHSCRQRALPVL